MIPAQIQQGSIITYKSSQNEFSDVDILINQFNETKIMLMEAVTKVNKLEQASNDKFSSSSKSDNPTTYVSFTANSGINKITGLNYTEPHTCHLPTYTN